MDKIKFEVHETMEAITSFILTERARARERERERERERDQWEPLNASFSGMTNNSNTVQFGYNLTIGTQNFYVITGICYRGNEMLRIILGLVRSYCTSDAKLLPHTLQPDYHSIIQ